MKIPIVVPNSPHVRLYDRTNFLINRRLACVCYFCVFVLRVSQLEAFDQRWNIARRAASLEKCQAREAGVKD